MKDLGIIRKVDPLGRIVLPKETRTVLDIQPGTHLEFWVDGTDIVLRKYEFTKKCIFCGSSDNIRIHANKAICSNCIKTMAMREKQSQ